MAATITHVGKFRPCSIFIVVFLLPAGQRPTTHSRHPIRNGKLLFRNASMFRQTIRRERADLTSLDFGRFFGFVARSFPVERQQFGESLHNARRNQNLGCVEIVVVQLRNELSTSSARRQNDGAVSHRTPSYGNHLQHLARFAVRQHARCSCVFCARARERRGRIIQRKQTQFTRSITSHRTCAKTHRTRDIDANADVNLTAFTEQSSANRTNFTVCGRLAWLQHGFRAFKQFVKRNRSHWKCFVDFELSQLLHFLLVGHSPRLTILDPSKTNGTMPVPKHDEKVRVDALELGAT